MKTNILKAFLLLISGALLFIVLISIFPVIGSFILPDFPIVQVLKENFSLLIPLFCVSIILAPLLGFFSTLLRKNRFFWLLVTGIFSYWITIFFVILFFAGISLFYSNIRIYFYISLWGMAAYAAFALPILIPVLLVLEKITRTKGEQKTEINKICDVLPAKNTTSERYDKISRWYDKIVFLFERKHMLSGIEKLSPKPGEQILEIGTGTGSMIIEIARQMNNKGKVYGVDISEEMIRKAKKNIQRSGLCNITDIQVGDAYKLKFADNFFDAVFMCFTLELFPTDDIPVILKECSRVLKPRGRIIRAC